MSKRFFKMAVALILTTATLLCSCGTSGTENGKEESYTSLDGKKVIFIGNSFVYYGQVVLEKTQKYLKQSSRENDKGYFNQLCLENGENVNVTNFTFGGHKLSDFYSGNCTADRGCDGVDHFSYITDKYYDYVCISAGSGEKSSTGFMDDMEHIMSFFREANPNVKFVYLCNHSAHGIANDPNRAPQSNVLASLKELEAQGVIIVDWGKIVRDCIDSGMIEGGSIPCNKNSFIIRKSASDGYHQNQLSGYITAVMTYCAITGRSAIDQPYEFCGNGAVRGEYSSLTYISKYYCYDGATTNYTDILASVSEMTALRAMIDKYLKEKPYLNYE